MFHHQSVTIFKYRHFSHIFGTNTFNFGYLMQILVHVIISNQFLAKVWKNLRQIKCKFDKSQFVVNSHLFSFLAIRIISFLQGANGKIYIPPKRNRDGGQYACFLAAIIFQNYRPLHVRPPPKLHFSASKGSFFKNETSSSIKTSRAKFLAVYYFIKMWFIVV